MPLGAIPLKVLCDLTGIGTWRGSLLTSPHFPSKCLPTYHPAGVLRQWDFHPIAVFDLKKAKENSTFPETRIPKRTFHINLSPTEALAALTRVRKEKLLTSFDIETTRWDDKGNTPFITHLSFSTDPLVGYCIPFINWEGAPRYSLENEVRILRAIKEMLEDPLVPKTAQNFSFDAGVFAYKYNIKVKNLHLDTMCGFHTIYSELPKSLDFITTIYTRQPYYAHLAREGYDNFQRYNCLDSMITLEACPLIEEDMRSFGVLPFYRKHINPLIPELLTLQLHGINVNVKAKKEAAAEFTKRLAIVEETIEYMCPGLNPRSSKQMCFLLYERLGYNIKRSRQTGKPTSNAEALETLAIAHGHPLLSLILEARRVGKLLSTYLLAPLSNDGRIHTAYNIGTAIKKDGKLVSGPGTGRISSSKSVVCNSGTNLQNQPKGLCRTLFIPDHPEEEFFWEIDLSQAEARVVAYLAQEEALIKAYSEGKDVHRLNASRIFGKPEEEITEEQRFFGKKHVHAFNYREGPKTLAAMARIPLSMAKAVREAYFTAAPGILLWHLEVESLLRKTQSLTNFFGRKRTFYGRWDNKLLNVATAQVPQSTIADLLNLILVNLSQRLKEEGIRARILLQVHDSVAGQCHHEDRKKFLNKTFLNPIFLIPLTIKGRTFTIPYDVSVGENWGALRKVTIK